MLHDVVVGLQEALQQEHNQTETLTIFQAPVDHVSNTVQSTQQHLYTQLQKNQSMMQMMQMQKMQFHVSHDSTMVDWVSRQPIQLPRLMRTRVTKQQELAWKPQR